MATNTTALSLDNCFLLCEHGAYGQRRIVRGPWSPGGFSGAAVALAGPVRTLPLGSLLCPGLAPGRRPKDCGGHGGPFRWQRPGCAAIRQSESVGLADSPHGRGATPGETY